LPPESVARADEPIVSPEAYLNGPLGQYLAVGPYLDLSDVGEPPAKESNPRLIAPWLLQDIGDYRAAMQQWFACLTVGGVLIVTVPHAFLYDRQNAAPSLRRPQQRRLYTPRALAEEIEEALAPNSYRLRWLGDLDQDYDYAAPHPTGRSDVAAVIERIPEPDWLLEAEIPSCPAPVDLFEPDHTRIEQARRFATGRILALKLDHLGDFLLGVPALERLRATFPTSEITLVVASWNEDLARSLDVADRLLVFDAYPRNSSEEPVDVPGKRSQFEALVPESYDLAIDMRTDPETRFLLRHVKAGLKAGLGTKAQFPFLDIFLPLETHLGHYDTAWSEELKPDRFWAQPGLARSSFSIHGDSKTARPAESALVWGPYLRLPPGDYVFEPFLEVGEDGLIACDVAVDVERVAYSVFPTPGATKLHFTNERDGAQVEFRLLGVENEPVADFRFYGGRISKRGASSALHQSEYLTLLIELLALRSAKTGMLSKARP
jgi:hypothetical protein